MNTVCTSGQLVKFIELGEQKGLDPEKFQNLLESGLLADLLASDPNTIPRKDFRKFLGLPPLPPVYDLDVFFRTRPGLWVSDDFRRLVVAKAGSGQTVATKSILLERGMADAQIEKMLGDGGHLFTEGDLLATLERMIQSQWGGKDGQLLNSGYANLFYTSSCVVNVHWGAGYGAWDVDTWQRDGYEWDAGSQVFSPATGTS